MIPVGKFENMLLGLHTYKIKFDAKLYTKNTSFLLGGHSLLSIYISVASVKMNVPMIDKFGVIQFMG